MTTKIEWCDETWNPIVGCQNVSEGCRNCYAVKMAHRLQAMQVLGYHQVTKINTNGTVQWTNQVNFIPQALSKPMKRRKPTTYFISSMSDPFHEHVSFDMLDQIIHIVNLTPQHTYQFLTKRAARMVEYFDTRQVPTNVRLGVTVENCISGLPRLEQLQQVQARRFLSIEPMLEDLGTINLSGISLVIVGGESGHQARPMKHEWVQNIHAQCREQQVPFFFKQWGTFGPDGVKRSKQANFRLFGGGHNHPLTQ